MENPKLFTLTLEPHSSGVFNFDALEPQPVSLYISQQIPGKDYPVAIKIEDKDHFYQDAAFWLSLIAIVVSVYNYIWTGRENKKARKRSIHDEFWLREVIYPNAIKPCLDFFTSVIQNLPVDLSDPKCVVDEVESFRQSFEKNFSLHSSQLLIAGYISKDLYVHLSTELNNLQDQIIEYCYLNKNGYNNDPAALILSRSTAIQNLSSFMTNFLKGIQVTQEGIG